MKRTLGILFTAVILLFAAVETKAQIAPTPYKLADATTFANSQTDTSRAIRIAGANLISHWLTVSDTADVIRSIEYNAYTDVEDDAAWTEIFRDTTDVNAATRKEASIRDSDSDLIDGIRGYLRVILIFDSSGNGATGSQVYYSWFYARP